MYILKNDAVKVSKEILMCFMDDNNIYDKPTLDALEYSLEAESEPFVYLLEYKNIANEKFKTIGIFTDIEKVKLNKEKFSKEHSNKIEFRCKRFELNNPNEILDW